MLIHFSTTEMFENLKVMMLIIYSKVQKIQMLKKLRKFKSFAEHI